MEGSGLMTFDGPFFKVKRVVDKALLRRYAQRPCAVGYGTHVGRSAGHHIRTKGAGGDDADPNLIPLCVSHHTGPGTGIHELGVAGFLERFGRFMSRENREKLEAHL